jgi:hypothetical protein
MNATVNAPAFYAEYHGHPLPQLVKFLAFCFVVLSHQLSQAVVHDFLRAQGKRIVWLVGDSSLDNKHWLYKDRLKPISDPAFENAVNGFGKKKFVFCFT